jgi:hypothetical protein
MGRVTRGHGACVRACACVRAGVGVWVWVLCVRACVRLRMQAAWQYLRANQAARLRACVAAPGAQYLYLRTTAHLFELLQRPPPALRVVHHARSFLAPTVPRSLFSPITHDTHDTHDTHTHTQRHSNSSIMEGRVPFPFYGSAAQHPPLSLSLSLSLARWSERRAAAWC